jgi:hypothetical protein
MDEQIGERLDDAVHEREVRCMSGRADLKGRIKSECLEVGWGVDP